MAKKPEAASTESRTPGVLARVAHRIGKAIIVTPEQHAMNRGLHIPLPDEIFAGVPSPEMSPGKARSNEVATLMHQAQEATPRGEPIGAYRAPDAPDHHLREVPEYLYDKSPDTKQQGEQ
jgi:hypothetical protein